MAPTKKKAANAADKSDTKAAETKTANKAAVKKPDVKKPAAKNEAAPEGSVVKATANKESAKKKTAKKQDSAPASKTTTPKKSEKVAPKKAVKATSGKKSSGTESRSATSDHQDKLKKAVKTRKQENKKKAAKKTEAKPFVMPKTQTEKTRKYTPAFTRSILDQPDQQSTEPLTRYSDVELTEFRDLISRKLESAKKELSYLQGLITRKDQMGGDESDNRYMTMEDGGLSMEREQLSQMASRQITFIDHLEKAMMRIENKTYGICRVTGKLIDKARLRAVPHATLSIEAKMGIAR